LEVVAGWSRSAQQMLKNTEKTFFDVKQDWRQRATSFFTFGSMSCFDIQFCATIFQNGDTNMKRILEPFKKK